jgi:signal transduction histidine kinase
MRYRHRLRTRIFLSYSLLGSVLGLFLGLFLFFAMERQERQLMDAYIGDELEHFMELSSVGPERMMHHARRWTGYKLKKGASPAELGFLTDLSPGIHELEHEGNVYDVGVAERGGMRFYLLYDDTRLELFEAHLLTLLIAAVFLAVVVAMCYGFWLSRRVIEPITSLARQVAALPPEETGQRLAGAYADDEVGMLAHALDQRMQRLATFIERERNFTADASHELRTPLAVIQAAGEGLLARDELPDYVRPKLLRIERAVHEMAQRLNVLLILARESVATGALKADTELAPVLQQSIEDHRALLTGDVQIEQNQEASPSVAAPIVVVSMLIGNLLKNAFSYTRSGRVVISLQTDHLIITDTGPGIDADEMPHLFEREYRGRGATGGGSGLGLAIVKRLCDHYGWRLTITPRAKSGTCIQWWFSDAES